mmetsp:Transcript_23016/g.53208  ORF Transcript_23016/g.53208 Transcript_23016/m.53208 type:complete len:117 (-) Transcript_23016:1201-1551(-)
MVGRLIGSGGSTYKELTMKTSCKIFVLDKEGPPPGYGDDERMVTLVGFDSQVAHGEMEINTIVQSALNRPTTGGGGRGGFRGIGPQSWNAAPPPSYPQPYVDLAEQSGRGVKRSLD